MMRSPRFYEPPWRILVFNIFQTLMMMEMTPMMMANLMMMRTVNCNVEKNTNQILTPFEVAKVLGGKHLKKTDDTVTTHTVFIFDLT
jgi:hypothetical protein